MKAWHDDNEAGSSVQARHVSSCVQGNSRGIAATALPVAAAAAAENHCLRSRSARDRGCMQQRSLTPHAATAATARPLNCLVHIGPPSKACMQHTSKGCWRSSQMECGVKRQPPRVFSPAHPTLTICSALSSSRELSLSESREGSVPHCLGHPTRISQHRSIKNNGAW